MDLLFSFHSIKRLSILTAEQPLREWSQHYCLLYILQGRGELKVNQNTILLQQGTVALCNRNRYFDLHGVEGNDLVLYSLSFDILEKKDGLPDQEVVYRPLQEPWRTDGEIFVQSYLQVFELVKRLYVLEEENSHPHTKQALLYELILLLEQERTLPLNPQEQHTYSIQQVVDYIHQHYKQQITREDLAQLAGFHPHVFSRIFKEETGDSFSHYLSKYRIKKAKALMLTTTKNLNDIASAVGYTSGLYLSRKFKQITGYSPSSFTALEKRIVIYDWVGNLLALGIKPVGAASFFGLHANPFLRDLVSDVTDVGRQSVEKVIALNPDLIIAPIWIGTSFIHRLENIAPTIVVPYGDPFDRFHQLAQILNKSEIAAQFMMNYQQKAEALRQRLLQVIQPDETVGLYEFSQNHSIWVLNDFHGRGGYNFFRGLGLKPPASIAQRVIGKGMPIEIQLEHLPLFAADHMIISYTYQDQDMPYIKELLEHPVWTELEDTKHPKIYYIDRNLYHANDVYSLYSQLDLLEELLQHPVKKSIHSNFVHESEDKLV